MPQSRTCPPNGRFTGIELRAVVSIIGLLIALLWPALSSSREASRRAQCPNDLEPIGIALLSYESANGSFPPGDVNRLIKNASEFGGWTGQDGLGYANALSWRALTLTQLDQSPLYNSINFNMPSDAGGADKGAGFTLLSTSLAVFLRPSDSGREDGFRASNTADANFRQRPQSEPRIGPATGVSMQVVSVKSYDGSFGDNYSYRTGQITRMGAIADGTSATIIAGEGLSAQRANNTLWDANRATAGTAIPMNLVTERAPCADGQHWTSLDVGCRFSYAFSGLKSEHPDGVNFLFRDGSIRFLKENIARTTYAALGSKAGRETISSHVF